ERRSRAGTDPPAQGGGRRGGARLRLARSVRSGRRRQARCAERVRARASRRRRRPGPVGAGARQPRRERDQVHGGGRARRGRRRRRSGRRRAQGRRRRDRHRRRGQGARLRPVLPRPGGARHGPRQRPRAARQPHDRRRPRRLPDRPRHARRRRHLRAQAAATVALVRPAARPRACDRLTAAAGAPRAQRAGGPARHVPARPSAQGNCPTNRSSFLVQIATQMDDKWKGRSRIFWSPVCSTGWGSRQEQQPLGDESSTFAADKAEGLPAGASRSWRGFSLRTYFGVLAALVVALSAASVVYVYVQSEDDARHDAERRSRAIADVVAGQLASDVRTLRATVANLAANAQIETAFSHPAGCTLTFASEAGGGHLDLVRPDGVVVCSSHALPGGSFAGGAGQPWVRRALEGPLFEAPARDALTGAQVVRYAAPAVHRAGVVAASLALAPLARALVDRYGQGEPVALLLTSRDGRIALSRSLQPARWSGSSLAGTPFARERSGTFRDLDGKTRIYETASVPGTGWRVFVGDDEAVVLHDARALARRELEIIVAGLVLVLAGLWFVYRRAGRPVAELATAVRSTSLDEAADPVAVRGPAEVRSLSEDVNVLVAAGRRELAGREEAEAHARDLAAIVESSNLAIFATSLEGTITSWNQAAAQLYGYTESEAVGRPVETLAPEERRDEAARLLERVRAGEVVDGYETVRVRKDGTLLDVSLTISPIRDRSGAIVGSSAIARDIGPRLRAEEALRRSEESYRELFERHPAPMWLFDPE